MFYIAFFFFLVSLCYEYLITWLTFILVLFIFQLICHLRDMGLWAILGFHTGKASTYSCRSLCLSVSLCLCLSISLCICLSVSVCLSVYDCVKRSTLLKTLFDLLLQFCFLITHTHTHSHRHSHRHTDTHTRTRTHTHTHTHTQTNKHNTHTRTHAHTQVQFYV